MLEDGLGRRALAEHEVAEGKHVAVGEALPLERAQLGEAQPDEREHARVRRHLQRRAQRAVAIGQAGRLGRERLL
mgnify:CR=1 FL=1